MSADPRQARGAERLVYQAPTQISVLEKSDVLDGGTVVPGFRLALAELFTEATETV